MTRRREGSANGEQRSEEAGRQRDRDLRAARDAAAAAAGDGAPVERLARIGERRTALRGEASIDLVADAGLIGGIYLEAHPTDLSVGRAAAARVIEVLVVREQAIADVAVHEADDRALERPTAALQRDADAIADLPAVEAREVRRRYERVWIGLPASNGRGIERDPRRPEIARMETGGVDGAEHLRGPRDRLEDAPLGIAGELQADPREALDPRHLADAIGVLAGEAVHEGAWALEDRHPRSRERARDHGRPAPHRGADQERDGEETPQQDEGEPARERAHDQPSPSMRRVGPLSTSSIAARTRSARSRPSSGANTAVSYFTMMEIPASEGVT